MIEFQGFGKIPRLNRDIVITEKIDGTNAAIGIKFVSFDPFAGDPDIPDDVFVIHRGGEDVNHMLNLAFIYAQSRKRIITPKQDNYGFARWVYDNAQTLLTDLGEGLHFGEWWGGGIQRGYGLEKGDKRFSLFNVKRWHDEPFQTPGVAAVPILFQGPFTTPSVNRALTDLRDFGSSAAPGFKQPEGIIIYHTAGNLLFKVTIENDEKPKALVA